MGEVLVVTSGKGGVGKSTVAANVGACLAQAGKTCLLTDMDMGLRSLDVILGLENKVVFDLYDLSEGMCRPKQALISHPQIEGLYLLSASQATGSAGLNPENVDKTVRVLARRFDFVLIDCPAGIGRGFRVACGCAERALLIETPEVVALRDAERVSALLSGMGAGACGFVLNRARYEQMVEDCPVSPAAFEKRLELPLLGLIPDAPESVVPGRPAALVPGEPGDAYRRVANRLMGRETPVVPIRRKPFFTRLKNALKG